MVVGSLSSFRILNSRSDEGITSTATTPQVLWKALLPFLTQRNSTTGIWTDGHFDPQLLVRTALTHAWQDIPSASPAAANNMYKTWLLHAVTPPNLFTAHPAAHSLRLQRGTDCHVSSNPCRLHPVPFISC